MASSNQANRPDQLQVGIVGMSSDHVWAMGDGLAAQSGVTLVAGAEGYPELRERARERWSLPRTYEDYRTMLDREELDAILVCTDNASKADVAVAAAARGIHVYQDKPMAANLAQADRILRAAEDAGITLMVAYHSAFNPLYGQVKSLLAGGAVGSVYLARGVTGHAGPVEFGCSQYFTEWLFDKQRNGGGAFVDEACYLIDGFVDNLGPVAEVSAFTAQIGYRDYLPSDVEDNSVAILRFANGALGVIDAKWGQVGPAPVRTSYHGSRGTLVSGPNGTEVYSTASPELPREWEPLDLASRPAHGRQAANLLGWRAPSGTPTGSGSGGAEQRHFVDCLRTGQPIAPAASPRLARHVQEVIEAVYQSAASGRAVRLPLG
ncbi:MAG TPA: Gfo/Idh/MocA family oxidoreductase [Chloroflexota bacterium]|nr:Gfo/Idh/MocA family oxidoreductase [Chloroflexota bacterium]